MLKKIIMSRHEINYVLLLAVNTIINANIFWVLFYVVVQFNYQTFQDKIRLLKNLKNGLEIEERCQGCRLEIYFKSTPLLLSPLNIKHSKARLIWIIIWVSQSESNNKTGSVRSLLLINRAGGLYGRILTERSLIKYANAFKKF